MASPGFSRHSLFLALRPPWDLACDLWEEFSWLQPDDDRVEPERLHVTLVQLGVWPRSPDAAIRQAQRVCASLRTGPFRVVFDQLIVGDRVLLKPSERPPALYRFQWRLKRQLAGAGLVGWRGPPFSPHITGSYRTRTRISAFVPPVSWVVRDFVLIESLVGRRTQIERGRWRLDDPA